MSAKGAGAKPKMKATVQMMHIIFFFIVASWFLYGESVKNQILESQVPTPPQQVDSYKLITSFLGHAID
jgi:hypothetical protein